MEKPCYKCFCNTRLCHIFYEIRDVVTVINNRQVTSSDGIAAVQRQTIFIKVDDYSKLVFRNYNIDTIVYMRKTKFDNPALPNIKLKIQI